MIGQKFLNVGMRGFAPVMANDEWRAPPPIPIVRDETDMVRALQAEFAAVERQERTCCLVMIRPDAEGVSEDVLMSAVGERLSRSLRPYDGLFTFGPDRYLISLPHIKPEDTATVMKRLCGQIADEPLTVGDDRALALTVSVGGAMIDPALPLQDNIERAARSL